MSAAPRYDSAEKSAGQRDQRRRAILVATGIVVALVLIAFLGRVVGGPPDGAVQLLVQPPQLSLIGGVTNQNLVISNSTPRPVSVSFTFQIWTNGSWAPAAESLFVHPRHSLEAGSWVEFAVPHPPTNAWRFAVLQQRLQAETWVGGLAGFLDRRRYPSRFSTNDHRGSEDKFLFSEPLETPASKNRPHRE